MRWIARGTLAIRAIHEVPVDYSAPIEELLVSARLRSVRWSRIQPVPPMIDRRICRRFVIGEVMRSCTSEQLFEAISHKRLRGAEIRETLTFLAAIADCYEYLPLIAVGGRT